MEVVKFFNDTLSTDRDSYYVVRLLWSNNSCLPDNKTIVSNRIKKINKLSTAEMWRHVFGQCNPADFPSRGCTLKTILDSRWLEGLRLPTKDCPNSEI